MNIEIENIGKEQDKYLNSFTKGNEIWLTEKNLYYILEDLFPDYKIVPQKKISSFKVDYLIEEENLIIEFQGYQHFTKTKIAYKDTSRFETLKNKSYKVMEIPYFIQLTSLVTNYLFNVEKDYSKGFPHGFVHPKAILPCDFCQLGKERYYNFLYQFPDEVKEQCESSIKKRGEIDNIPYYDLI